MGSFFGQSVNRPIMGMEAQGPAGEVTYPMLLMTAALHTASKAGKAGAASTSLRAAIINLVAGAPAVTVVGDVVGRSGLLLAGTALLNEDVGDRNAKTLGEPPALQRMPRRVRKVEGKNIAATAKDSTLCTAKCSSSIRQLGKC